MQKAVKQHNVGPLLYQNLVESGSNTWIPDQVVEHLRSYSKQMAIRHLSMTKSLLSLLEKFDEAGIPALTYKGPAFSLAVYDDLSLRQSRDLDILIEPDFLYEAEAILRERGFKPKRRLTEKQKQLLVQNGRHRTMEKEGLIVELHPRISRFNAPSEVTELLERAESVELLGYRIPVMSSTDSLFTLAVHGTRHRWNQLKWICDIAYLIRNRNFDWPAILEESKQRNCYRCVLLACGLSVTVFGTEIPDIIRTRLQSIDSTLLDATYPDCLLGTDDTTSLRYRLRSLDDDLDRVRYCWNKLTTPSLRDTNTIPLPESLFWLYYIFHPSRVLYSKSVLTARTLRSLISDGVRRLI